MSLIQSTEFASASAAGKDWREASKAVLEQLEEAQKTGVKFNLGWLYITDDLAEDAGSIINLFRSVLNIEHWIGAVGVGICAGAQAYVDQPAISAMIGQFDEGTFCVFNGADNPENLDLWLKTHPPMMVYIHGNPLAEQDPAIAIKTLEDQTQGFLLGGLSSSRNEHAQFAGGLAKNGLSGVAFSQDIPVATTLSQGCVPIGEIHTISRGAGNTIFELDDRRAVDVFEDDLRAMAIKKLDRDPDDIIVSDDMIETGDIPEELHSVFKGEIHAAFPVTGSDQKDYLVRGLMGLDNEEGSIMISQPISHGEQIMFVHRNDQTVMKDLSQSLVALRERVTKDTGRFTPKAALYISCLARAYGETPETGALGEMKLIHDIIGDVPLTGFYAGGEINKARLYGYTGILTLFL